MTKRTHLEVEIEEIVNDEPSYFRTTIYNVHYKNKEAIKSVLDIYSSPTLKIAADTLVKTLGSD